MKQSRQSMAAGFTFEEAVKNETAKRLPAELLGLVFSCPYTQDNPETCLFHAIRQLAPAARVRWLQTLEESQLVAIKAQHCLCLQQYETGSKPIESSKKQ